MEAVVKTCEPLKRYSKRIAALGLVAAAGLLAGCGGYYTKKSTAERIAERQYQQAYKGSSPAGKFALQYLLQSKTGVHESFDSSIGGTDWVIDINSGCLGGSSYNINGGTIHASAKASGLFSVAEADVDAQLPAASAYFDWTPTKPDDITIHSGNPHAPPLHFSGLASGGSLRPMDAQTIDKLEGSGCKQGLISVRSVSSLDSPGDEPISPWMQWSSGK